MVTLASAWVEKRQADRKSAYRTRWSPEAKLDVLALRRARMRSSSAPASRLYPTTSATRIAASFRVSLIAALRLAEAWHKNN